MDITVIIVSWNNQNLIKECLQKLTEQSIQAKRIIVIDNNSSDHSADVADTFENVEVLKMDSNLGFAAGNNRALEECGTEWVALLNPDAFPEKDWIKALQEATLNSPTVTAFGSRQLCEADTSIIDGLGDSYHISGQAWRTRHGAQQKEDDLIAKEIFSPCAAAALYKRQALIDIGGFDEDYFCYMEDVDLGFRLRLAGHEILSAPSAIVHHVGSGSTGGQHSDFAVYHGHRNLVWTYIKNMPHFLFWFLLPLHILLNIITIVWFCTRGQGQIILRAKMDAMKCLPYVWTKRRHVQRRRVCSTLDIWRVLNKGLYGKNS